MSIKEGSFQKCAQILNECELAELRIDLCGFSLEEIEALLGVNSNIIVTCRVGGEFDSDYCNKVLFLAVERGAAGVDIEIERGEDDIERIREKIAQCGKKTKLIVSYHNYHSTPSVEELLMVWKRCIEVGADIQKVVTMANSREDAERVLTLYEKVEERGRLVAFAMGEEGSFSRLESIKLGAPFTYVAHSTDAQTAPGQIVLHQFQY